MYHSITAYNSCPEKRSSETSAMGALQGYEAGDEIKMRLYTDGFRSTPAEGGASCPRKPGETGRKSSVWQDGRYDRFFIAGCGGTMQGEGFPPPDPRMNT